MAHSDINAFKALSKRLAEKLEKHGGQVDKPSVKILSMIQRMEQKAAALDKVRISRHPMDTEAAHLRKVAKAATNMRNESAEVRARIGAVYSQAAAEIVDAIDKQAGLVEGKYDAEIRTAFRSMTDSERSKTLTKALQEGNSEIIAAVCTGPAVLSGVNEVLRSNMLTSIRKQKSADLLEEFDELNEALNTANAAERITESMFRDNYDSRKMAEIDKQEAAAEAAQAALIC